MGKFKRLMWIVAPAGLGAAGTIDGRLQSSANSNFTGVHNITGTNFTQIVGNNLTSTVEVRADQVTQANAGDRYVRLQLTTAGNVLTGVAAVGLGGEAEQKPAGPNYDLNTTYVQQRVVCNI